MKNASRRVRRMERHHKQAKGAPLNLVSLMDIFTILVFFLLVNSSSSPQLPNHKDLALPSSTARTSPDETLILAITPEAVLLGGRQVISVADVKNDADDIIEPLRRELDLQRQNRQLRPTGMGDDAEVSEKITIMGDQSVPYEVMHKILATCQKAKYTDIAFAAQQKAKPNS